MSGTMKAVLAALAGVVVVSVAVVMLGGDDSSGAGAGAVLSPKTAEDAGRFDLSAADASEPQTATRTPVPAASFDAGAETPQADTTSAAGLADAGPQTELTGRVVDGTGRPVRGAAVSFLAGGEGLLRLRFGVDDDAEVPQWATTTTDSQGRFAFKASLPDEATDDDDLFLGGASLVVSHDDFATLVESQSDLDNTVTSPHDVGDLVVEPGAWVTGRVVDGAGRPVAGADVRARSEVAPEQRHSMLLPFLGNVVSQVFNRTETGSDGRFLIKGVRPGVVSVTARKSGMRLAASEDVEIPVRGQQDVGDLVMEAGETIAGYVLDDGGNPVAGADVRVSSMARIVMNSVEDAPKRDFGHEMSLRAETDESGWFELSGLAGGTYTVHARAAGFARTSKENVPVGTFDTRLYLTELGSILVRLTSSRDGEPIDGAKIEYSEHQTGFDGFRMRSAAGSDVLSGAEALAAAGRDGDPAGVYLIPDAGPNGTDVTVLADGFALNETEGPAVGSGELATLPIELVPETVVRGLVTNLKGEPVAGASVRVREHVPPEPEMEFIGSGGQREVRRSISRTIGGPDSAIRDALTTRTDSDGVYEVRGLTAGDWEVLAKADTFVPSDPVVLTLDEGQLIDTVDITLAIGGSIRGLVTEADGVPVPGMDVMISPAKAAASGPEDALAGQLGMMLGVEADGSTRATTNDEGLYDADGLAPGRYKVKLSPPQVHSFGGNMVFALRMEGDDGKDDGAVFVDVVAGEQAVADLVRPRRGEISGRVLAAGQAAKETTVSLKEAGTFSPFGGTTVKTDGFGNFVFEDVEAGNYTISAMPAGAALEEQVDVELAEGERRSADLVFDGATLKGRVVDMDSGFGAPGVSLTVAEVEQQSGGMFGELASSIGGEANVEVAFVTTSGGGSSGMSMTLAGGPASKVRTDSQGWFELKYLKPGTYNIEALGGGYIPGEIGPIEVEDGQLLDDVTLELRKGAVVRGRVLSGETGQAMGQVPVQLRAISDDGTEMMSFTEDDGAYSFEGLEPGEYTVSAMGSGFMSAPMAEEPVTVEAGDNRTVDLVAETQDS